MNQPPGPGAAGPVAPVPLSHVRQGADIGTRTFAFLVDVVLLIVIWFVVGAAIVTTLGNILGRLGFIIDVQFYIQSPPTVCTLLPFLLLALVYFPLFEAMAAGTPGKWLFGLRVLSLEGGPPTPREAIIRSLYRFIDAVAAYAVMKPPLYQRLGDKATGTTVATLEHAQAGVPARWPQIALPAAAYLVLTALIRLSVMMPFLRVR